MLTHSLSFVFWNWAFSFRAGIGFIFELRYVSGWGCRIRGGTKVSVFYGIYFCIPIPLASFIIIDSISG